MIDSTPMGDMWRNNMSFGGYAIMLGCESAPGTLMLGYDKYTYFSMCKDTLEAIMDDVKDEHPYLKIVPVEMLFRNPGNKEMLSRSLTALQDFVDCVEAAGGLVPDPEGSGLSGLKGADDWIDLADAYEKACAVLGKEPKQYKENY